MSIQRLRKIVLLAVAGLGYGLAAGQSASAGGRVIVDPCDDCSQPTHCQQFCYTMKLHCVYFKRACTMKYMLLPTSQACPPAGYDCPPSGGSFPYPTISGYGVPRVNTAPPGV